MTVHPAIDLALLRLHGFGHGDGFGAFFVGLLLIGVVVWVVTRNSRSSI